MPVRMEDHVLVKTFIANEALAKFRIVIASGTADRVEYPAAADDTQMVGITITSAAAAADPVQVVMLGNALLEVNGNSVNIAIGDPMKAETALGLGAKAAPTSAAVIECIGYANEASTADGDIISVFLSKFESRGAA